MNHRKLPELEHPIRRRLWKAGGLLAIFIFTLCACNRFAPAGGGITQAMLGHDFLVFYSAGEMARHGDWRDLYDLTAIKSVEAANGQSAGLGVGFGPFWNPPFAAWVFAPYTLLSFSQALIAWYITGAAALVASIALLAGFLPDGANWRNWGLIALLLITSSPLLAVITHGQNTFLTLLIVSATAALWRNRRVVLAGAAAGLLLYKPQHAALIAVVLIVSLGWRAALGFGATGAAIAGVTIFTMAGAATDYMHKLPRLLAIMQEQNAYAWDRHVTLKAFWRLLLQGTAAGPMKRPARILWWASEAAVAGLLARVIWQSRTNAEQNDRVIAMAIAASPLLVPFFFDYDLLILAVPATLCAARAMRQGVDRRQLASWIILFITLHVGTYVSRPTHFIFAVPALVGVVACIAYPKQAQAAAKQIEPELAPVAMAA